MQAAVATPQGWCPLDVDPFSGAYGQGNPNASLVGALMQTTLPERAGHPQIPLDLITRVIARPRLAGMRYWAAVQVTGPGGLAFMAMDPAGEAYEDYNEALETAESYLQHLLASPGCLGRLVLGPRPGVEDAAAGSVRED